MTYLILQIKKEHYDHVLNVLNNTLEYLLGNNYRLLELFKTDKVNTLMIYFEGSLDKLSFLAGRLAITLKPYLEKLLVNDGRYLRELPLSKFRSE